MQGVQQQLTGVSGRAYIVQRHTVAAFMDPVDVADFKARKIAHAPSIAERKQMLLKDYRVGNKSSNPGKK